MLEGKPPQAFTMAHTKSNFEKYLKEPPPVEE